MRQVKPVSYQKKLKARLFRSVLHKYVGRPMAVNSNLILHMPAEPNQSRPTAVIVGAGPNVLGAVRALQRYSIPTVLVVRHKTDIALRSRYPKKKLVVKYSPEDDSLLLKTLCDLNVGRSVLIPCSDLVVSFINRNQERLNKKFAYCVPPIEIGEMLLDKAVEVGHVSAIGIPVPKTVSELPNSVDEIVNKLQLPLIVKPRSAEYQTKFGAKNQIISTRKELSQLLESKQKMLGELLAQELIPGPDSEQWVCNCTFDRSSKLSSAFVFRRLGLSPAHRGVTSYATSDQNLEVVSLVQRLGENLKYVGPAMVEFKFDLRDQSYKYLEINPRIGLCNNFDTNCGVNNVYYTYCIAAGITLSETMPKQQRRAVFINFFGDLFARWEDNQSFGNIFTTYLRNANRIHYGLYWSWRDPYPALVNCSRNCSRIVRGIVKTILGRRSQQKSW